MKKSGLFVINCGMFQDEVLVSYNLTKEEVSKKLKTVKGVILQIKDWVLTVDEKVSMDKAFVYTNDEKNLAWISFNDWDGSWENYDTLAHESVHLMQFYKKRKCLECEETEAYLMEYFFRTLRRKLPMRK